MYNIWRSVFQNSLKLGCSLLLVGWGMNVTVTLVNGGRMPVLTQDVAPAFVPSEICPEHNPSWNKEYFYAKDTYIDEENRPAKLLVLSDRYLVDATVLSNKKLHPVLERLLALLDFKRNECGRHVLHYLSIGDFLIYGGVIFGLFAIATLMGAVLSDLVHYYDKRLKR